MHVQVTPYAVTCSMKEVDTFLPHGITCANVYLRATTPCRELAQSQSDMSFEHQRVVNLFLFCQGPQSDGTCYVRRTILILSTTVQQE